MRVELTSVLGWLVSAAFCASFVLTGAVRRYALSRRMVDEPNDRSSHSVVTPRGGGLSFVASTLVALPTLAIAGLLDWQAVWALAGAGALVASIGFADDHRHVPARWRLLVHFAAAAWALASLGSLAPVSFLGLQLAPGPVGFAFAALYLVWLLNLFNFMDGIDGIASTEAICVCLGGAVLALQAGQPGLVGAPLVVAAGVAGFLVWNFPPARIFMGDAGSGFLGIVLGVMSLHAAAASPDLFWSWTILLGVFVVDATLTLVRRLFRGEKVHEAHRSHAYQHAARRYGHRPVTLATAGITLAGLFPIAMAVLNGWLSAPLGIFIAYSPLVAIGLRFGAGTR